MNKCLLLALAAIVILGAATPARAASPFYDHHAPAVFAPFDTRVGSQGFQAPLYADAALSTVLERQALAELDLGSDAYKFSLDRDAYPDMPDPAGLTSVVDKINKMPPYQHVLDMPFKFTCMWEYPLGSVYVSFHDGMSLQERQIEYKQFYDLARYLLQRYQGTGRSFLIGHWEGDWTLLNGFDSSQNPTPAAIQGMIDYYTVRQQAMVDARASLPNCKNVYVYHYAEVNLVQKSIDNPTSQTVSTAVLPNVTVDVVSYSAYDATSYTPSPYNPTTVMNRVATHLNFIKSHAKLSGVWPFAQPVFVSEFGYSWASNKNTQNTRNTYGLRAAAKWGAPLILYWSIFSTPGADDLKLIAPDYSHTLEYGTLQSILEQTSSLRDLTRILLGRNPSDAEQNVLMDAFQTKTVASMLQDAYNGAEFAALGDNAAFLTVLFQQALVPTGDSGAALYSTLLAGLNAGTTTRWQTQLNLIDSAEARATVPDADFVHYLYRQTLARPYVDIAPSDENAALALLAGGTKRSALWQQFLNTAEFGLQGFTLRNEAALFAQTYQRFVLDFSNPNAAQSWRMYSE